MRRKNVNYLMIKIIAWLNLLAWIFPPLGMLLGFATLKFSDYVPERRKTYKALAVAGVLLTLLNCMAVVLMQMFGIKL